MSNQPNQLASIRKGAGRPVVADKAKLRSIRLTDADWGKYIKRGHDKWLRAMLNVK